MTDNETDNVNENRNNGPIVAIGVMVVAVVVSLVLLGRGSTRAGERDPAPLQAIEQGQDHIEPMALAMEIMAARPDFALVDVRPADEYAAFHLPRARNLDLPALLGAEGDLLFAGHPRLVVLYSNGPAHPGQAWLELQRRGRSNVKVLDGGLDAFKTAVLTPISLRGDAATEEQSKAEAAALALRTAFFRKASAKNPLQTWATDPPALTAPTVVSPAWLHERLGRVTVVDAREKAADFAALHVPGALHLPAVSLREKFLDRDMMLLPAQQLATRFGELGIANEAPVVICAEEKMQDATLLALAFLRVGHRSLAILEGGLLRWAAEQRPLIADATPARAPATYLPVADADDFTITADQLAARLGKDIAVLDVRPADFFRGDKSTEARPGHIPGAVNRLYSQDLTRTDDGHYWRPKAELAADYAALGLDPAAPVAVSCRTGHTASESFFVLRYLLGYRQAKWFNGSWTEWAARSELPAELGDGREGKGEQHGK